jgi:hypothetical protein
MFASLWASLFPPEQEISHADSGKIRSQARSARARPRAIAAMKSQLLAYLKANQTAVGRPGRT